MEEIKESPEIIKEDSVKDKTLTNKSKVNARKNNKKKYEKNLYGNSSNRSVMHSVQMSEAGRVVAGLKRNQIDAYDELESYKKLLKKRKKRLIARIITFLVLLIVAPIMIFFGTIIIDRNGKHDFFGLTFYIVISNSMEPEIKVNDCVVLKKVKSENLNIGDDVGYINQQGKVVVHRIVDIVESDSGMRQFVTAGINNSSSDQMYVPFDSIVGKRVSTMHSLGNVVIFFRSAGGIVLLIFMFLAIVGGFFVAFKFSEDIRYIETIEN